MSSSDNPTIIKLNNLKYDILVDLKINKNNVQVHERIGLSDTSYMKCRIDTLEWVLSKIDRSLKDLEWTF